MNKRMIIPKLPYEREIRSLCGSDWRNLPVREIDGAFGIAIIFAVLNGTEPDINKIADALSVHTSLIYDAFIRLSANGIFLAGKLKKDRREIKSLNKTTLGYYAGYASGFTGIAA